MDQRWIKDGGLCRDLPSFTADVSIRYYRNFSYTLVCHNLGLARVARDKGRPRGGHRMTRCATVRTAQRGRNSTLRDSISVPQLVFLPRAAIAGSAAILSPRCTMKAS